MRRLLNAARGYRRARARSRRSRSDLELQAAHCRPRPGRHAARRRRRPRQGRVTCGRRRGRRPGCPSIGRRSSDRAARARAGDPRRGSQRAAWPRPDEPQPRLRLGDGEHRADDPRDRRGDHLARRARSCTASAPCRRSPGALRRLRLPRVQPPEPSGELGTRDADSRTRAALGLLRATRYAPGAQTRTRWRLQARDRRACKHRPAAKVERLELSYVWIRHDLPPI